MTCYRCEANLTHCLSQCEDKEVLCDGLVAANPRVFDDCVVSPLYSGVCCRGVKCCISRHGAWPDSFTMVIDAAHKARMWHSGQLRRNGDPYILHPCRVAGYVASHLRASTAAVSAAYLHDVVEDCGVSIDVITKLFGDHVSTLVEFLTKVPESLESRSEIRFGAMLSKLSDAPKIVKIIKLYDCFDNLLDSRSLSEVDFVVRFAEKTRKIVEVCRDGDNALAEVVDSEARSIIAARG